MAHGVLSLVGSTMKGEDLDLNERRKHGNKDWACLSGNPSQISGGLWRPIYVVLEDIRAFLSLKVVGTFHGFWSWAAEIRCRVGRQKAIPSVVDHPARWNGSTRIALLDANRLVSAVERGPRDAQGVEWWLYGHHHGWAAGVAVPSGRHLCWSEGLRS